MAPLKRARQDWQKEARERHILDSAAALFTASGRLPAMSEVAERAGLAKGTLYLYFRGREALWLELLNGCFERWVAAILDVLADRPALDGAAVARAIIDSAGVDPMLIPLSTYNATLIEPNAGPVEADRFKATTADLIRTLGQFLAPRLGLAEPDATRRVLLSYAMLLGLWQVATPVPPIRSEKERLAAPGFWTLDWKREAGLGLTALWTAPAHG
ncbi:MAG: TetR/AcrR family transcriptional regulator [Sphingomonadaceae bacterium]